MRGMKRQTHHKELAHDRLTDRFDELMDDEPIRADVPEVLVDRFLGGPAPFLCSTRAAVSAA